MSEGQQIWLVVNDASGSNRVAAREALEQSFRSAGFDVARTIRFPDQGLPDAAALDAAGVATVAVFAGDGTVNALISALAGWGGSLLVLPGGTMNLLYHRLHGDRLADEVIRRAASGEVRAVRPGVISCRFGMAYADLLAGPGTSWYHVREAMREGDALGVADAAAQAVGETLATPGIAFSKPRIGRRQGYPLVMLTPTRHGIRVWGFHAETPGDYLKESWAMLRRRFREGPHDDLGFHEHVTLSSTADEPFGLLVDGEKEESPGSEEFRLVPCALDLLATEGDGK